MPGIRQRRRRRSSGRMFNGKLKGYKLQMLQAELIVALILVGY
jgi:hypothetical protein